MNNAFAWLAADAVMFVAIVWCAGATKSILGLTPRHAQRIVSALIERGVSARSAAAVFCSSACVVLNAGAVSREGRRR